MASTLLIVQFILAILIVVAVLLQKSSSIGLGAYSGSNDTMFGAKGPANFLTKATFILGLLFVINTLSLGYIYNQERLNSAIDNVNTETLIPTAPTNSIVETNPVPSAPTVPTTK